VIILSITIEKLKELSTERSFERGVDYYEGGYVNDPIKFGNTILADVLGNSSPYYEVEINIKNPSQNFCSCPYDYGGICKHRIALALKWIHEQDSFEEKKELDNYREIEYEDYDLFEYLTSMDLIYILNSIINDDKSKILEVLKYREQIDQMNLELYNIKSKVLKDLIIENIEKNIKEGVLSIKQSNSFYNYIHELNNLLNYQDITKRLRKEIIDSIIEKLSNRNCPEKDLMHDIIKSTIQSKEELTYVIDKIKKANYNGAEYFLEKLNENEIDFY